MTLVRGVEGRGSLSVRQSGKFTFPVDAFESDIQGMVFDKPITRLVDHRAYGTIKEVPFRITATSSGTFLGWIAPKTDAENASRPVVVALRVLDPWRCEPGGLVLQPASTDETIRRTFVLKPRVQGLTIPERLKLEPPRSGIEATLVKSDGQFTVEVLVKPREFTSAWGGSIEILDASNQSLVRVPLAVFPESANPKP